MKTLLISLFISSLIANSATLNWPQWRGPNGDGIASGERVPIEWSDTKNLKWKLKLPGAGASSPSIWGEQIFLTCYSGYGVSGPGGDLRKLMRHVVCVNTRTGKIEWQKNIKPQGDEDRYGGMGVPEHGYATATPATDGKSVFISLGKTGLLAFDMKGKELWRTETGAESSGKRWGASASPVLHGDKVFVNALLRGHKILALNKSDGKVAWKWSPSNIAPYQDSYATPALIKTDTRTDLVLAVSNEIWAFDPAKGGINWYAYTSVGGSNISPSVIAGSGAIFAFGGYPRQSGIALKVGGKGDISKSHQLWTSSRAPYVPSPVYHKGHLYWMDRSGYAVCLNAKTGKEVFRERLNSRNRIPKFYASPVYVNGQIISVSRNAGSFVIEAKPKFKQLAQNEFTGDRSVFNASPAVVNNCLYLRSDTHLYCIGK